MRSLQVPGPTLVEIETAGELLQAIFGFDSITRVSLQKYVNTSNTRVQLVKVVGSCSRLGISLGVGTWERRRLKNP